MLYWVFLNRTVFTFNYVQTNEWFIYKMCIEIIYLIYTYIYVCVFVCVCVCVCIKIDLATYKGWYAMKPKQSFLYR